MIIKFYCKNGHYYEVEEAKLIAEPQSHRYCYCGEKLSISNLEDIVSFDIEKKVKENIDKYIKELGIEGAWELIERNKDQSCARLYFEEFNRRGINLNKKGY